MKTIITGGTGLLGNALALDLARDGHEAIILSRNPAGMTINSQGIRVVQWDGKSAQGWGELADGAEAIVNLAGENLAAGRWTDARRQRILESRINAGQAVTQAIQAAKNKPKTVIQSSAVGYYGIHKGEHLAETEPAGDDFLAQVCQKWEDATKAVEALGVRRCVLRTAVMLSPQATILRRFWLPMFFFVGGPLGSGKQWLPWIHLQDAARAVRFLIENPACQGVYNLAAPENTDNRQFVTTLGKVMHRPSIVPVPGFALRLLFGEMSVIVLEGQNVSVERLLRSGFTFQYPQLESALRNLL